MELAMTTSYESTQAIQSMHDGKTPGRLLRISSAIILGWFVKWITSESKIHYF
jgi:hypothetical protein